MPIGARIHPELDRVFFGKSAPNKSSSPMDGTTWPGECDFVEIALDQATPSHVGKYVCGRPSARPSAEGNSVITEELQERLLK